MMPLSDELATAVPASTYSVAIKCSFPRSCFSLAVDLRARLRRAVEASFRRHVASHDDRRGQAPALIVAGARAIPVIPRPVEVEVGLPARMVHQPDELVVAVARQDGTVRVQVIVDEFQLEIARMGHDQDPGLV